MAKKIKVLIGIYTLNLQSLCNNLLKYQSNQVNLPHHHSKKRVPRINIKIKKNKDKAYILIKIIGDNKTISISKRTKINKIVKN